MSLRQRLLMAVAAALLASLSLGTWVTAWQMAHMVRSELSVSLKSGLRTVTTALQDMAKPPSHDALIRLVAGFDGNQHVMAVLRMAGQPIVSSRPGQSGVTAPDWFAAIAAAHLAPVALPVPGGAIELLAVQQSEVGERWVEAGRLIGLLALSAALAALFCFSTAAWSLRPLGPLAEAFSALEKGQPAPPVLARGPPEIVHLATAFNRMQDALGRAAQENGRLLTQLETIAEEERAELARDLHDDIGPLMFALTAWATAARLQEEAGNHAACRTSLQALESAAGALQSAVRGLLGRLRESAPVTTDLPSAVADLLAFWRGIRPHTRFTASIDSRTGLLSETVRTTLFRVAQEGVSNAIRHADPGAVEVTIVLDDAGAFNDARASGDAVALDHEIALGNARATITVQDDGATNGPVGSGLGLIGLEERLHALGGTLVVERAAGWRLVGRAPAQPGAPRALVGRYQG